MAERNSTFKNASVPVNVKSRHDESNEVVTTGTWGWLQPIYTIDCIPGDVVNYKPNIYIRTPALETATFGSIKVSQHSFFVPARLLWDDWQNFLLGGDNGRQVYTKPYVKFGDLALLLCVDTPWREGVTSLTDSFFDEVLRGLGATADHTEIVHQERGLYSSLVLGLGLNPFAGTENLDLQNSNLVTKVFNQKIDMMPFRAYQKIWWDYYRDSVLIPESAKDTYIKTDGGLQYEIDYGAVDDIQDFPGIEQLTSRKKCFKKDYFTTAKLDPQQGTASIVPVDVASRELNPGIDTTLSGDSYLGITGVNNAPAGRVYKNGSNVANANDKLGQFSVEVLRVANSYQRFFEKNNAVGSRPIAQILARYGMTPSAERLDMAEYVEGEDRVLRIEQVTSTAQTSDGDLAEVSAYGWVRHQGSNQRYVVREHGFFMSLLAIEPLTGYCDGIDPMFQCFEKEQHYTPEFENNGYDAVANKEVYSALLKQDDGSALVDPDNAWGFQPRYSRYKYKKDVIAGDMARLNTAKGADAFHTFRRFNQTPALNEKFVEIHTSQYGNNFNRLFKDTNDDYDPFYINVFNQNIMERPMTGFATPALSNVNEQDGRHISVPYGGVRM